MIKPSPSLLAIGLVVALGCQPKPPESNLQGTATHGGLNFRFLDKSGAVEIGTEVAASKVAGASKANSHQICAYFTGPDGSPLASPPSGVKILRGDLPPIVLTPQEEPGKSGRFASAPGPRLDDLRGSLEATIDGKKVEVPFSIH